MQQAIRNILLLWYIPVKRWPMGYHLVLAVGACVLTAVLGMFGLFQISSQRQQLKAEYATLKEELTTLGEARSSSVSSDPTKGFPQIRHTDDVVRDIGRFAQNVGLQITNLTVNRLPSTPSQLGRVQFSITAIGQYRSIKAWLSELLARYSSLGVGSLSVQKSASDPKQQDVHLILVWYVQGD